MMGMVRAPQGTRTAIGSKEGQMEEIVTHFALTNGIPVAERT